MTMKTMRLVLLATAGVLTAAGAAEAEKFKCGEDRRRLHLWA